MLFRQPRVGQGGVVFTMFKFQTMRNGAVTRPWLRHTGLDELPQIVNVLRGDMRVFGPRPEMPLYDEAFSALVPMWKYRHAYKPGLLSLAGVEGVARGEGRYSLPEKARQAQLDVYMMDNMSLRMRLRILAKLPRAILRGQKGA